MSLLNDKKLNQLLSEWPQGAIYSATWLKEQGVSKQLLNRYRKSNWVESAGTGAVYRVGDNPSYEGGLYALQHQLGFSVHIGAKSALAIQGKSHYLQLNTTKVFVFGDKAEKLPTWFAKRDWGLEVAYSSTNFLSSNTGMIDFEFKTFKLKISSPARAMLECLYLAPEDQNLVECYELMEGLTNLRPNLVQTLLEECNSIKAKRLFLYFAERAKHPWFEYLDLSKIDIGKGKRSLVKQGALVPKYNITLPKELVDNGTVQEPS